MPVAGLIFWIFLAASIAILIAVGGQAGRQLAFACLLATVLTSIVGRELHVIQHRIVHVLIDLGLLLYAVRLSLVQNRFWLIWFAAFQLCAVVVGVACLFLDAGTQWYALLSGFWALPALGAAAIGAVLDHRRGL